MKLFLLTAGVALLNFILNTTSVNAQKKSKDLQENSLYVSFPVKVDGKLTEWKDSLQAFNRNALLGYTIANDDRNLYLVVKSSDAANNTKILLGGITWAINTEGKKKEDEAFALTFPVIKLAPRSTTQRIQGEGGNQRQFNWSEQQQQKKASKAADSAVIERRRAQLAQYREIKVSGSKEIQDSLISIYNEYGVKVAATYDNEGSRIYEMAVPLKILGLNKDSKNELAYNIKLNGRVFTPRPISNSQNERSGNRGGDRTRYNNNDAGNTGIFPLLQPVDFWGKYSLALN